MKRQVTLYLVGRSVVGRVGAVDGTRMEGDEVGARVGAHVGNEVGSFVGAYVG